MHQAVEEIIDRLAGAITFEKSHYTLKDLLSAGYPPFIVERIRIEINEKIKEELSVPASGWVDTEAQMVKRAWMDFQETAFSNSHIPQEKLYSLLGEVITGIVRVILEPRQHMTGYIFQGAEELSYKEMVARTNKLTIYQHFGRAIPLYMQKRDLKTINRQKCKALIYNLDSKLVASYSAEEWARVLQPLFILFGGKVDTQLIQHFFEDKDLYLTAKAFNELDRKVDRKQFVEILSYPDLLDIELQEKFKEKYREQLISRKNRFDTSSDQEVKVDENEQKLIDNFFEGYEEETLASSDMEEGLSSFNDFFASEESEKSFSKGFEEDEDESKDRDDKLFHENLATVLDEAVNSFKSLTEEDSDESGPETEEKEPEDIQPDPVEETETEEEPTQWVAPDHDPVEEEEGIAGEEDEKPMWQQYITPEQMDLMMAEREEESEAAEETVEPPEDEIQIPEDNLQEEESFSFVSEEDHDQDEDDDTSGNDLNSMFTPAGEEDEESILVEDDFVDDPISEGERPSLNDQAAFDYTEEADDKGNNGSVTLAEFLEDKEKMFVKSLFGRSKKSYRKALAELNEFDNWKNASGYLREEIFKRNKVDMFSEDAVEFTDRLQTYFSENK